MMKKETVYLIVGGECRHQETDIRRDQWKAYVTMRRAHLTTELVTGSGTGSSPRVACREAVSDAFGHLDRHRVR